MKIAILIIATHKYIKFISPLLESFQKYFLINVQKTYFVFTDRIDEILNGKDICSLYIDHYPFPFPTLFRFFFFQKYYEKFKDFDQIVYIDVDSLVVDNVGDEVISPRCVVQHCGYVGRRGDYETNNLSKFYVRPDEGKHYFGGGFWSFSNFEFNRLVIFATENLVIDFNNHIIPKWHDESVLNRWLIDNSPTKILSPSYHYPESPNDHFINLWKDQGVTFQPKIVMLNKNHLEIRT